MLARDVGCPACAGPLARAERPRLRVRVRVRAGRSAHGWHGPGLPPHTLAAAARPLRAGASAGQGSAGLRKV